MVSVSKQTSSPPLETERGQLVLVAAVFIAVSFVPVTVAYLQLGYSADIEASSDPASDSLESTTRLLQRAVHAETNNTTAWTQRNATVTALHNQLEPHTSAIETERITTEAVQRVRYNESAASKWSLTNCPNGSARQFGPCTADRGIVIQERIGETHVLAVAFDVTLTTDQERIEATVIVQPIGRLAAPASTVTPLQRSTKHEETDSERS